MQVSPIHFHKKHSNDYPLYKVIKSKIPEYAEIVVNFFDHCNLRCVFCPQEHEDLVGATRQEILSKVDLVVQFMHNNPSPDFHIHAMGGELFQDQFIEQGFLDIYQEFVDEVKRRAPEGRGIVFRFISNLVFEHTQPVHEFITRNDLDLAISYDPVGRFNVKDFEVFRRNVETFKDVIRVVSLTMTRQSMATILAGKDPYYDYLYSLFPCDWDYLLVAKKELNVLMPTEKELFEFLKHLIDFYPNCINIEQYTKQDNGLSQKTACTRGNNFTVFSDNSIPSGCSGAVIMRDTIAKDDGDSEVVEKFISQRDCLGCEYYRRCTFTCFVSNEYSDMVRDLGSCVYKELFKYVEHQPR